MAVGDITYFDEALDFSFFGGWEEADDIRLAIVTDAVDPTEAHGTPVLADFTEVTDAGSYVNGGVSIGDWGTLSVEAAGVLTFDSATNPNWAQHGSNGADAYWGILFNQTQAGDPAFAYVDLAGPVDMSAGPLTVTWHANGIFRITKP